MIADSEIIKRSVIKKEEEVKERENARRKFINSIKQIDLFNKKDNYVVQKSRTGGFISFVVIVIIIFLFIAEFSAYREIKRRDTMGVDTSTEKFIKIYFNISFPALKCQQVSVDTVDASGSANIDIWHDVVKQPITKDMKILPIGGQGFVNRYKTTYYDEQDDPHSPNYCGRCYDEPEEEFLEVPENYDPEQQGLKPMVKRDRKVCCNTCDQVIIQLRNLGKPVPPKETIAQCKEDLYNDESNVGCNIYGVLRIEKVTGNFHFAPGRSFSKIQGERVSHVHEFNQDLVKNYNHTHLIHELRFGDKIDAIQNALDGSLKVSEGTSIHKYFVNVVPTTVSRSFWRAGDYYQYSFTEHVHVYNQEETVQMPGLFIIFDFSPIRITYTYYRLPFTHFLTKICAVLGGVFSISKFFDRVLEDSIEYARKKFE